MNKHTPKPWLWPDRTIGKRESRILREEHNEAINQREELLAALQWYADNAINMLNHPDQYRANDSHVRNARNAIRKATQA